MHRAFSSVGCSTSCFAAAHAAPQAPWQPHPLVHSWAQPRVPPPAHEPSLVSGTGLCARHSRSQSATRGRRRSCRCQADVVGLGQAMIDFAAHVDDPFLQRFSVEKGGRRLISAQERTEVLQALDGSYQVNAAGSLTNTLLALCRVGQAATQAGQGQQLSIAAACLGGDDALGFFYRRQLENTGVELLTEPQPDSHTGVVMVLTTPDANRTFLTHLGNSTQTSVSPRLSAAITGCRLLLVEGYLWELPGAEAFIGHAMKIARENGAMVAMTAGDAGIMARHREEVLRALQQGVDVMFMNQGEAQSLLNDQDITVASAAMELASQCAMVAITDGSKGSSICTLGRLLTVPPYWTPSPPIDSCGAGDAYAAGMIFGLLAGLDPAAMGSCGSRFASAIISKHGATLTLPEASELLSGLPSPTGTMCNLRMLLCDQPCLAPQVAAHVQ